MPCLEGGQGPCGEEGQEHSPLSLTHAGRRGVPGNILRPPRGAGPGGQISGTGLASASRGWGGGVMCPWDFSLCVHFQGSVKR